MPIKHDQILHSSAILTVGLFDCPIDSPDFNNTGPISNYLLAFPRTAVKIRHVDMDHAFVADPNTVTIYNKGQEYERYPLSAYGDRCDWLALCPEIIYEILSDIGVKSHGEPEHIFKISHAMTSVATYTDFRKLTNNLANTLQHDSLLMEEQALNVFRITIAEAYRKHGSMTGPKRATTSVKHKKLAQGCIEVLARHYTEPLSLVPVAQELNTSPYHLCRVFRDLIGMTIHQYVSQLRLRTALHCVAETDVDLSTLGLDLGFSDHSHFSHYFRKTFGETPSKYRQNSGFSDTLSSIYECRNRARFS